MNKEEKQIKKWKNNKKVKRRLWMPFAIFLFVGVFSITVSLLLEILLSRRIYTTVMIQDVSEKNIAQQMNGLIQTLNTILGAVVIFVYSVQDNKKMGISNRSILTYSFGSYSIPVFFITTMILLPIELLLLNFNMMLSFSITLVFIYILQMITIVITLVSTSYRFIFVTINNAEIRQYDGLSKIQDGVMKLKYNSFEKMNSGLFHLEQIIMSDELINVKMQLINRILCVPFGEKEKFLKLNCREKRNGVGIDRNKLEMNNLYLIYWFYYENISSVMDYLSKSENNTERNKLYFTFYEFIKKMEITYKEYRETDKKNNVQNNFLMTVSGILNAVMDSDAIDTEGFCNYVFNECIRDKELRKKQVVLYIIFQEYLYRTYIKKGVICSRIRLKNVKAIKGINAIHGWNMTKNDKQICHKFWEIWMSMTTLSEKNINCYFYNAISTWTEDEYNSEPVAYIKQLINARG